MIKSIYKSFQRGKMSNIKILDCTLRDGGYVNNWDFGLNNIQTIVENLSMAKIDYIEYGYLNTICSNKDKSFFSSFNLWDNICKTQSLLGLMVNFGEYPITNIPDCKNPKTFIRVAFKKEDLDGALEYCEKLKQKGYELFINPMHTASYSESELKKMINIVNHISPKAFSIVDTNGSMTEQEALSLFNFIDKILSSEIAICFHSHNNLQLSFGNAQCLIKACKNRELIIDSTLFGIGRGAGNIHTEDLANYLNENNNTNYCIIPILKTVNEIIYPIFNSNPWGHSIAYYLAAINNCHPNYARFFIQNNLPENLADQFFLSIPEDKKLKYDEKFITQIKNSFLIAK